MNKFFKYAGITAGVCFGVGILFVIIGAVCGAKGVIAFTKDGGFEIIDSQTIWTHKDMDLEAFTSIDIQTDAADVEIVESTNGTYGIDATILGDGSSIEFTNKDGVMTLKDAGSDIRFTLDLSTWNNTSDNKVIIYVPKETELDSVDIQCAAGDIDITGPDEIKNLTLISNVGDIDITGGDYGIVNITTDVGDLTMKKTDIYSSFYVNGDVGDIEVDGHLECNIEVETNVGDVDISTGMPESDFQFYISTNIGEVEMYGTDTEGLSGTLEGNKNAPFTLNATTDTGDVTVQ